MKKKIIIIVLSVIIFLAIYPLVQINTNGKIIKFGYSMDVSKYEEHPCYGENYYYVKDKDISIYDFDFKQFLFFHMITMKYNKGNKCDSEFLLKSEYIEDVINNAEIIYNEKNIDLKKLIEGKTPIEDNKKYFGNEFNISIEYKLNGKEEILYIFYVNDLLVIQVGLSDEGPKYIAYK